MMIQMKKLEERDALQARKGLGSRKQLRRGDSKPLKLSVLLGALAVTTVQSSSGPDMIEITSAKDWFIRDKIPGITKFQPDKEVEECHPRSQKLLNYLRSVNAEEIYPGFLKEVREVMNEYDRCKIVTQRKDGKSGRINHTLTTWGLATNPMSRRIRDKFLKNLNLNLDLFDLSKTKGKITNIKVEPGQKLRQHCLHQDGADLIILVYVDLKNHSTGTTFAAHPDEVFEIEGIEGFGYIGTDSALHGRPTLPVSEATARTFFRIHLYYKDNIKKECIMIDSTSLGLSPPVDEVPLATLAWRGDGDIVALDQSISMGKRVKIKGTDYLDNAKVIKIDGDDVVIEFQDKSRRGEKKKVKVEQLKAWTFLGSIQDWKRGKRCQENRILIRATPAADDEDMGNVMTQHPDPLFFEGQTVKYGAAGIKVKICQHTGYVNGEHTYIIKPIRGFGFKLPATEKELKLVSAGRRLMQRLMQYETVPLKQYA